MTPGPHTRIQMENMYVMWDENETDVTLMPLPV